jgi:sirohydrochlorin cobaltochelatase
MIARLTAAVVLAAAISPLSLCAQARTAPGGEYGVLVMAHGGAPVWNAAVSASVAQLVARYPTELALGMADAGSLDSAVRRLEARGVRRIGVVRLFISGESFLERTEQIFGLRDGAPPKTSDAEHAHHGAGHAMGFWRISTNARIALSREGLQDADAMGPVLAARARALSQDPAREQVIIIGHGPGDDAENARWIDAINRRADAVRAIAPFARVHVATLREDWPDKRPAAEAALRGYVTSGAARGLATLVIPFRLQGMGPYAKVLEGLSYRADGQGLVPHANVGAWLLAQADAIRAQLDAQRAADVP